MTRLSWMALIILMLFVAATAAARERVWTDTSGRTMRAEFVREVDGEVTFLRGGKLVTIPLDKLSAGDQQVIRDLAAGKPLPEDAPATPQAGEFGSGDSAPAARDDAASKAAPGDDASEPLIKQPIAIENRVWTDIHGNQTTARYVRIFGSNVVLSRSGRSITVKYHELTTDDQEYLQELLASRGQEAMIPPATSADLSSGQPSPADNDSPMNREPTEAADNDGDSSVAAAAGGYGPGGRSPMGSDSGNASSAPYAGSSPFGPATSGPGSYGGIATPGYAPPTTTALPPGMSSPTTTSPSSSGYNYGSAPAASNYDSGMASGGHYPSRLRDRVSYGQPSSNDYAMSSDPVVGACSSCRRSVALSQSSADRCPHCGIRWSYKQDPVTRQKLPIPRLDSPAVNFDPQTARTIGIVVGAFIGLLIVVGLIIGVIYAVMGLASVSSGNRDRQQYLR